MSNFDKQQEIADSATMKIEKGTYGAAELRREAPTGNKPPVVLVHLALVGGYSMFGGGAIVGKFGVHNTSPIMFELAREVISSALLLATLYITRQSTLPEAEDIPRIVLGGLSFFMNQVAWFVGLKLADPVTGSAWQAFLPILTTGLSVVMGRSKLQAMQALGISVAAGGAILMVLLDSRAQTAELIGAEGGPSGASRAISHLIFFAGISGTAGYFLVHNGLGSKYSAMATVMWSNMVSSTLLFLTHCTALASKTLTGLLCSSSDAAAEAQCAAQGFHIPRSILGPLTYEVIICTIVAWPLLNWANQHTDPSVTTVYMGMHPVTSTIISAVLVIWFGLEWGARFDMSLPGVKDTGILLIVLGLLLIFRSEQAKREGAAAKKKCEDTCA